MSEDKFSVYVVVVEATEDAFIALSDVIVEGPEEMARDVSFDEALLLVKDLRVFANFTFPP